MCLKQQTGLQHGRGCEPEITIRIFMSSFTYLFQRTSASWSVRKVVNISSVTAVREYRRYVERVVTVLRYVAS